MQTLGETERVSELDLERDLNKSTGRTRLLVLSDLHAFCGPEKDDSPSRLAMNGIDSESARLFDSCLEALKSAGISKVDAVLCPGDITDRAQPEALRRAWKQLSDLAEQLSAPLIATAGNHDLDSRNRLAVDPKQSLMELAPEFPSGSADGRLGYFAENFHLHELDRLRVLSLNSAAHHGLSFNGKKELDHGRVTDATRRWIAERIESLDRSKLNVLLTHHHPIQLPDFDLSEKSQMVDGDQLLSLLEKQGSWLFVHGHKHRPYIHYSSGGGRSPVIFSAGSFAAKMTGEYEQAVTNQFYVIELLSYEESDELDLGLAGTISAWTYSPWGPDAWNKNATGVFPAVSGFGWRGVADLIARSMGDWVDSQVGSVTRQDLYQKFPKLPFLSPSDLAMTVDELRKTGRYVVNLDNDKRIDLMYQSSPSSKGAP